MINSPRFLRSSLALSLPLSHACFFLSSLEINAHPHTDPVRVHTDASPGQIAYEGLPHFVLYSLLSQSSPLLSLSLSRPLHKEIATPTTQECSLVPLYTKLFATYPTTTVSFQTPWHLLIFTGQKISGVFHYTFGCLRNRTVLNCTDTSNKPRVIIDHFTNLLINLFQFE